MHSLVIHSIKKVQFYVLRLVNIRETANAYFLSDECAEDSLCLFIWW